MGRGSIDFEEIIRALNDIGYTGPLSVEWEDGKMDREHGAPRVGGVPAPHGLRADVRSTSKRCSQPEQFRLEIQKRTGGLPATQT